MSYDTGGSASPITTASALRCPHGGAVRAEVGSRGTVRVGGAQVATAADTFTVTGCPHIEGGRHRPCTTVRFTPDTGTGGGRLLADGLPVLLSTSAAQCFADDLTPQGPPVAGDAPQGVSCR